MSLTYVRPFPNSDGVIRFVLTMGIYRALQAASQVSKRGLWYKSSAGCSVSHLRRFWADDGLQVRDTCFR